MAIIQSTCIQCVTTSSRACSSNMNNLVCLAKTFVQPGPASIPIFRNFARRLNVVLCRFHMLLKDFRSAHFSIAYVPCKKRWTSTIRMEASLGSLKCWLIMSRSYEWLSRRRQAAPASL